MWTRSDHLRFPSNTGYLSLYVIERAGVVWELKIGRNAFGNLQYAESNPGGYPVLGKDIIVIVVKGTTEFY